MNNTPRMSVLLMALLSQLSFAPYAQAEPSNEWGVWANGDEPPPPQNWSSNQQYQPNPDQTRTSVNDGNLLEAIASGDWIGYVLYDTTQTVVTSVSVTGSGSFTTTTTNILAQNQLAMLTLNPQRNAPTEEVAVQAFVSVGTTNTGTLDITSDLNAFNMSFDSANNSAADCECDFEFGNTDAKFQGQFDPGQSNAPKQANSLFDNRWTQTYYGQIQLYDGSRFSGTSPFTQGNGYFGKIMSAVDIAFLSTPQNTRYQLYGTSYLKSEVYLEVNFADKTWTGEWSANNPSNTSFKHNGFNVTEGTINGSTLTSTQLLGTPRNESSPSIGDVQGGTVQGTLVGIANANAQDVGVVGKTTLTVVSGIFESGAPNPTKVVNDVFIVTGNSFKPTQAQ